MLIDHTVRCDHRGPASGAGNPHRLAARVLQDALIQMLGDGGEDDDDGDDANDGAENTQPCEPCEPAPEVTEQELVAAAYFARVREELGWSEMGPLPSRAVARGAQSIVQWLRRHPTLNERPAAVGGAGRSLLRGWWAAV